MKLHIVDILIICAYLMVIVAIGLFLKKKAAKNMDSYFLGGKSLPFYMLGLSVWYWYLGSIMLLYTSLIGTSV